ncbi:precorrin-8X methylmutase [Synechocystis sp. LEGE 06083]|uniref:precorrin-8X methylmutase n=1 Tax=Synechocystis sp. LEGE 06083 TaxID=915336 RepID=UPI00187EA077|nr:precorrin-8X methylmutase [Synechocystis sp. LEGE 06083]MBE9193978.1 precorrin-8X methylmutase [Synechocystis sp. LEGE 06083]
MKTDHLTIKELTDAVGGGVTPRMVRHYHTLGLLPPVKRSESNYRLYTQQDVQRLQRVIALKQQGFQLSHIRHLLDSHSEENLDPTLMVQLQQQYHSVIQQITRLRQTAFALEGLLGRDQNCQITQAEALAQLKCLDVDVQEGLGKLDQLWMNLDAETTTHPEAFQESLKHLLPDLSAYSEITIHLLHQLVLACGDVSLVNAVRLSQGAIATARDALKGGCLIMTDVPVVAAALDQTRLAHLGCTVEKLIDEPHITGVSEAEQAFWNHDHCQRRLQQIPKGCVLVIGYAPSVLLTACKLMEQQQIQPALVIGMPIGFSHAPGAKRRLINTPVPHITIQGSLGGGLLAAVTLNALVETLIAKPDCHCYLTCL